MSSAFLTLIVLPYVTLLIEGIATWMQRIWRSSGRKVSGPIGEAIPVEVPIESSALQLSGSLRAARL